MARVFLAVPLGARARRSLARWLPRLEELGSGLRVVRDDGLHLTLRFLGEVPPELESPLRAAVAAAAAAATPFPISLAGLGTFPERGASRVVWAGVGAGAEGLAGLAGLLEERLAEAGFQRETRPFRAHCTLARVVEGLSREAGLGLEGLCHEAAQGPPVEMRVGEVALVESVPQPSAPNRYQVRASWPLRSG